MIFLRFVHAVETANIHSSNLQNCNNFSCTQKICMMKKIDSTVMNHCNIHACMIYSLISPQVKMYCVIMRAWFSCRGNNYAKPSFVCFYFACTAYTVGFASLLMSKFILSRNLEIIIFLFWVVVCADIFQDRRVLRSWLFFQHRKWFGSCFHLASFCE